MTHRIVQLTDCHLFADPARALQGIATWPRLAAVLRSAGRQVPDAELLLFTGDTAHDEAQETYESVRDVLAEWGERVRVIPGNHDDRGLLRSVFSQGGEDTNGRVMFRVSWSDWQVIGLDSQCPGELPGSLGAEQLDWLRARLEATPVHTMLCLHHPPIAVQSPWLDTIGLQDASALERLLWRHPQVRLIVCGHVHQAIAGSLGHATVLTTPAVGPQFRPRTEKLEIEPAPPAYRLIDLNSDGRWLTQVLRPTESPEAE